MKKIIGKLKNRCGLTLTELLVTLAILSLFSSAVLVGMSTAYAVRRDSIKANDAEILASMITNYLSAELRTATNIAVEEDGKKITYQSNERGIRSVTLYVKGAAGDGDGEGQLYETVHAETEVDQQVFSPAAYSDPSASKLQISELVFEHDEANHTVKVSLSISDSQGREISTAAREFTVGLLNQ